MTMHIFRRLNNRKTYSLLLAATVFAFFGCLSLMQMHNNNNGRGHIRRNKMSWRLPFDPPSNPEINAPSSRKTFSTSVEQTHDWYKTSCLNYETGRVLSIEIIQQIITRWSLSLKIDCVNSYNKFIDIYNVTQRSGQVIVPDTFKPKVKKWLNNNEELYKEVHLQYITSIFNQYTHESTIFNPLRSKRPGVAGADNVRKYVDDLIEKSKQDCDFCTYKRNTAEDSFGRIESTHSVTASNVFKYDAYHALIIMKSHNSITFNEEQFLDTMNTAKKWFMKVYETDSRYKYPHVMWDNLPKASASQIHAHAQASVAPTRYYGLMEHIILAASEYAQKNSKSNYFTDLLQIHTALGLTTTLGNATAMAYITPKKDNEVFIMSQTANTDFFRLLYYTIKAFTEDLNLYAWSFAMILPKLEPSIKTDNIPAMVRIISRGPANVARNDISAMELFAASNVNIDPFTVIGHVEKSIAKRSMYS